MGEPDARRLLEEDYIPAAGMLRQVTKNEREHWDARVMSTGISLAVFFDRIANTLDALGKQGTSNFLPERYIPHPGLWCAECQNLFAIPDVRDGQGLTAVLCCAECGQKLALVALIVFDETPTLEDARRQRERASMYVHQVRR